MMNSRQLTSILHARACLGQSRKHRRLLALSFPPTQRPQFFWTHVLTGQRLFLETQLFHHTLLLCPQNPAMKFRKDVSPLIYPENNCQIYICKIICFNYPIKNNSILLQNAIFTSIEASAIDYLLRHQA